MGTVGSVSVNHVWFVVLFVVRWPVLEDVSDGNCVV